MMQKNFKKSYVPEILRRSEVLINKLDEERQKFSSTKFDEGKVSEQRLRSQLKEMRISIKDEDVLRNEKGIMKK